LLVANTGYPFSFVPLDDRDDSSGIHSICRYGASTKGSLRFKGQFGIGIKSVDEVSDEVHILSGGFRLRFNRERLRSALGAHAPDRLPLLYAPEWFEDAEAPAGAVALAEEYDTVVALRLTSTDREEIRHRLKEIGPVEVLLLETLRELTFVDQEERHFSLELRDSEPERWRVTKRRESGPDERTEFLLFRAPIGQGPQDHRVAWPMDQGGALEPLAPAARRFHTFYPISREHSGAPFLVHSYFQLDPSRKGFVDGAAERQANEALFDGVLDLLEQSLPALSAHSRGTHPLHALIWPDEQAASPQGQVFVDRLRSRAWALPIFEGYEDGPREAVEFGWPAPGAGLDAALSGMDAGAAPFPRGAELVRHRPEAAPPSPLALARWLRERPPRLPSPARFGELLTALYRLIPTEDRASFCEAARGAEVLPIQGAAGVRWIGLEDGISVFRAAEGQEPTVPPALEGLLRAHILAPDALQEDPALLGIAAETLFDVRAFSPHELVESLMDSIDARDGLNQGEVLAALGFVAEVLGDELGQLQGTPLPWIWDAKWWSPTGPWALRRRLARLPIPLAKRSAQHGERLVVEAQPGELSVLYPDGHEQAFINEQTEHPEAKAILGRFGDWEQRRRVYAFLGAWPMPRLHAVDLPERDRPALSCPHSGLSDEDWSAYVHSESGRQWFGNVSVRRSVAWPDLPTIARHCAETGRLGTLLAQIARHAGHFLEYRGGRFDHQTPLWITKGKYFPSCVSWQLRSTPWLPTTRKGEAAVASRPDQSWWTEHRLDPSRLHEARWNHLPFAHAGNCPRELAIALRMPIYEEPRSPNRDRSLVCTIEALSALHERSEDGDDPGLRRLYRELIERLADLAPREIKGMDQVLAVTGGGAARPHPVGDVYLDDLQTPLPLGVDVLPLAIFATGVQKARRLARTLGLRLLSDQVIEYHAEDRDLDLPAEQTLTSWLQWLRPYIFAVRACSHLVPVAQRIDLTVSAELINRYTLAVVEVVESVELRIDGGAIARQSAAEPVVLAHQPDSRQTIPLFLRRALADRHAEHAEKLLPILARPAAELAGDATLAHTVELLVLTIGAPDDVRAEAFLRDRCGVDAKQLATVREACGVISAARDLATEEARIQARRTLWLARTSALARPLLGLVLVQGRSLGLRDIRARLEAHRDAEDPLAAATTAFVSLGVPADHPVWALENGEQAEAFLAEHPELSNALSAAISAHEAVAERKRALEAELQRARLVLLALARARAPEARIQELIAAWDEIAERADPEKPGALARVIRTFIEQLRLGESLEPQVLGSPDGRLWSAAHLEALGLSAAAVTEVSIEVQRFLEGAQDVQTRRENAYAAWVRSQGLHRSVKRVRPTLAPSSKPGSKPPIRSGPAQELTMDTTGGTRRHSRKHRRNSLVGGLGEVFVLMQELEIWRGLETSEREALLQEIAAEYSDLKADQVIQIVLDGQPGSESWENALASLLRIGDYSGARCDLLGVGDDGRLRYVEVKSTSSKRLDRFFLSAPEWEFLSKPEVRDRCAIVCVADAAPGRTPRVEVLDQPAVLVKNRLLAMEPSTHRVVVRRA